MLDVMAVAAVLDANHLNAIAVTTAIDVQKMLEGATHLTISLADAMRNLVDGRGLDRDAGSNGLAPLLGKEKLANSLRTFVVEEVLLEERNRLLLQLVHQVRKRKLCEFMVSEEDEGTQPLMSLWLIQLELLNTRTKWQKSLAEPRELVSPGQTEILQVILRQRRPGGLGVRKRRNPSF